MATRMVLSYLGSKASTMGVLRAVIRPLIAKCRRRHGSCSFGDFFAGSGAVGSYFSRHVDRVVACDMELYSYVLNRALLKCPFTPRLNAIISSLNTHCRPVRGLVHREFSERGKRSRSVFTAQAAQRIDSMRIAISSMARRGLISYNELIFLLASLICTTSRAANNTGTFRAYLKSFAKKCHQKFMLRPVHRNSVVNGAKCSRVYKNDSRAVARRVPVNIAYLDPPYNSNHYGGVYSFFNYLCMYDHRVTPVGVAGILPYYNKSEFGFSKTAEKALLELLHAIQADFIVMSYNNEAAVPKARLVRMMQGFGAVTVYKSWNRRYRSNSHKPSRDVVDYTFVIDTRRKGLPRERWVDVPRAHNFLSSNYK